VSDDKERKKIIQYIKKYYSESGKTPSMKEILSECTVNSRVFYELLGSQKEAFNLAGVPYSDEARSKVEKANVARKFGKSKIISRRPSVFIKSALRNLSIINDEEKYVDKHSFKLERIMEKLNNIYSKYRQIYSNDHDSIKEAHDQMISFSMEWCRILQFRDQQYESVRAMRYSTSLDKTILTSILGYDFNDIEGSYRNICETEFTDLSYRNKLYLFDTKAKAYFKMMLDEVFGVPPNLTIDI
jgi:hypothetical protein